MNVLVDYAAMDPRHEWPHHYHADAPYALTETHYFGCYVPEANLDCEIYIWYHPALKIASAGVFMFSKFSGSHVASDYFDYHYYLPWPLVDDHSIKLANGLELWIDEPLERFRIRYSNAGQETSLDLHYKAVTPAIMRPQALESEKADSVGYESGGLEQTLKVEGDLVLRGQRHRVDGYFVRDRSYGQIRSEAIGQGPPFGWVAGAFGADLSFGVLGFEHPDLAPAWAGEYPVPAEKTLFWGWICRDGKIFDVTRAARVMTRHENGLWPIAAHFELEDTAGHVTKITSTIEALQQWGTWANIELIWGMTRYRTGDREGWGTTQEVFFPDFARRHYQTK